MSGSDSADDSNDSSAEGGEDDDNDDDDCDDDENSSEEDNKNTVLSNFNLFSSTMYVALMNMNIKKLSSDELCLIGLSDRRVNQLNPNSIMLPKDLKE